MKITKRQLKRIIQEEREKLIRESFNHPDEGAYEIVDMIIERAVQTGLIRGEDAAMLQSVVQWALMGGDSGLPFRLQTEY